MGFFMVFGLVPGGAKMHRRIVELCSRYGARMLCGQILLQPSPSISIHNDVCNRRAGRIVPIAAETVLVLRDHRRASNQYQKNQEVTLTRPRTFIAHQFVSCLYLATFM